MTTRPQDLIDLKSEKGRIISPQGGFVPTCSVVAFTLKLAWERIEKYKRLTSNNYSEAAYPYRSCC